jgi:hypothetical protein
VGETRSSVTEARAELVVRRAAVQDRLAQVQRAQARNQGN